MKKAEMYASFTTVLYVSTPKRRRDQNLWSRSQSRETSETLETETETTSDDMLLRYCRSVISWSSIKTDGWIVLVSGKDASFHFFYTVF